MSSFRAFALKAHHLPRCASRPSPVFRNPLILQNRILLHPKHQISQNRAIGVRYASTARTDGSSFLSALRNFVYGTSLILVVFVGYYTATDTRFELQKWIIVPGLRFLYPDAEDAHRVSLKTLKNLYEFGLHPRERGTADAAGDLQVEIFGHKLANPVGISAGLDKGAEVPDQLFVLGASYVEVGGITPLAQEGNPKPRLFRIPSQNALINRFGLNSEGADRVALRLRNRVRQFAYSLGYGADEAAERYVLNGGAGVPPGSLTEGKLLGVQIAKNKVTPDDVKDVVRDYVTCVNKLAKYADVIVVNVSSPNTENLRDLQRQEPLTQILTAVVDAAQKTDRKTKPAVMVKVSPDEDSPEQINGICQAILDSNVDGIIVANTTKARPDPLPAGYQLPSKDAAVLQKEQGGYSGPQLFPRAVTLVKRYREILDRGILNDEASPGSEKKRKVIFCSGGITNGRQALEALHAGADLVQVYTALVYGGPGLVSKIKSEMRTAIAEGNGNAK